jgi:thiosulfate/3-mercaptopyruvate sulfurtransferase
VDELAALVRAGSRGGTLVVLDATVVLPRPRVDGDHRASGGRAGWAAAHIPGAQHLDLLTEFTDPAAGFHFAQPSVARAREVLEGLGVTDDSRIVLYDRADGFWAARAWWSLRALGVDGQVLDGGLDAWTASGGRVEPDEPDDGGGEPARAARGALTLHPDPTAWVDRGDVLDIIAGRRRGTLVCALGTDQFDATAPTRYSRRGHIPTSVSLPARGFTSAAGRVLPSDELRRVADRALPSHGPVVVYCGGGVSASYAALGLVLAGRRDVSIYDGSLEEWSADPRLPLVVPDR